MFLQTNLATHYGLQPLSSQPTVLRDHHTARSARLSIEESSLVVVYLENGIEI